MLHSVQTTSERARRCAASKLALTTTIMPKTGGFYCRKDKTHVMCTPTKRARIERMRDKENMTFAAIGAEFNIGRREELSGHEGDRRPVCARETEQEKPWSPPLQRRGGATHDRERGQWRGA